MIWSCVESENHVENFKFFCLLKEIFQIIFKSMVDKVGGGKIQFL